MTSMKWISGHGPARAVLLVAGLALAGPASATVTVAANICEGVNTVRVVTLGQNTYEYFFQTLPGGPIVHFAGITNPTSATHTRKFPLPAGRYRLTFKIPNTAPVGSYAPDVVIRPYTVVNGICAFTDPRNVARPVGGPAH